MEDGIRTRLLDAGIDLDATLERFCHNDALLLGFLRDFAEDENAADMRRTHDQAGEEFMDATHALKGVCGNLGMTELFALTGELMTQLRKGDAAGRAEIDSLYEQVMAEYGRLCGALNGL